MTKFFMTLQMYINVQNHQSYQCDHKTRNNTLVQNLYLVNPTAEFYKTNMSHITAKIFNPALDGLGRLRLFDVLQCLVQQHVSRRRVGLAQDLPVEQAAPPHARLLQLDAAAQR